MTNGPGGSARFNSPESVTVDAAGNVYVADYYQAGLNPPTTVIRKITPDGNVTTYAGSYSLSDPSVNGDSSGRLMSVFGITADATGILYAVDWQDSRVKKIGRDGTITTVAGDGRVGPRDGQGIDAQFTRPGAIAVDAAGYLYVAELSLNMVRKISPTGAVSTLVNAATRLPALVRHICYGIAVDHNGIVYSIDNHGDASDPFEAVYRIEPARTGPVITTQPVDRAVGVGSSVLFTATASGTPSPTYQWWKNGEGIFGATDNSYAITSAQSSDLGAYRMVATNSEGTVTSHAAQLSFSQSISFPTPPSLPFGRFRANLMATASSGLPVVFEILSGPGTINGTQVSFTGVGAIIVRATQSGDANYGSASAVVRQFNVTRDFPSWQAENFTSDELVDASQSGPNAVHGQDRLTNLLKYALGLNPKANAGSALPGLHATATDWVYTFTRPADRPDLTYHVEVSTDLVTWSTTGVFPELVSNSGGNEIWLARVPLIIADNLYFRLKVSVLESPPD